MRINVVTLFPEFFREPLRLSIPGRAAEAGLVDIYQGMKPDAAAGQLNLINPVLASAIIMKLPARQSSQILAEMEPEKAAALTEIISAAGSRNAQRNPS